MKQQNIIGLAFIIMSSATLAQRSAVAVAAAFVQLSRRSHQQRQHGWRHPSSPSAQIFNTRPPSGSLWVKSLSVSSRPRPCSRTTVSSSAGPYMAAATVDEEETETANIKSVDSTWDVPGLKKEVFRVIQRCHKKTGQANQRLAKA